jgi:hypothetical protein
MRKNPYLSTVVDSGAIVLFSTHRRDHRMTGKRAAESYLSEIFGRGEARKIIRRDYFTVDTLADALLCKAEMEAYCDSLVGQRVFTTSVWIRPSIG